MKNKSIIFAASKPNSILLTSKVVAFFIAANIGLSTLADCCTLRSVIEFGDLGGDSLSYTLIFHSQMPNSMKDYSGVKHSNAAVTSAHETGKIFSFEGTTDVQVVIINGNPWFVAVDVCNALNLQNTSDRIKDVLDKSFNNQSGMKLTIESTKQLIKELKKNYQII
ncbi:MAG: hypothetical protein FWD60_11110 [Candidatus Azobacteroides sp.]|nr:hypothetical protein [Candidatus Azobacteroides sp.]